MAVAGVPLNNVVPIDQLQPGDHIYYQTLCYAYTHHGIYVGDEQVIFRKCGESVESAAAPTTSEALPTYEKYESSYTGDGLMCKSSVKDFVKLHDLRMFRYGVAAARATLAPSGTCTEYPRTTHAKTVELAEWLLRHPEVFHEYDSSAWHCQHFATFCCTTWLTISDLDEALQRRTLTRDFLLEHSNANGNQTEGLLPKIRTASRVLISPVMLVLDSVGSKLLKADVGKEND